MSSISTFTPASIKKLPQGIYPISAYPGLRMVVSASTRTWSYRFRDGRNLLKQTRLGSFPELSLAQAVAAWESARTQRTKPVVITRTVKDLIDAYVIEHLQVKRKEPGNRSDMLYRHIGNLWNVDAAEIGRPEAHTLLTGLRDKPAIQRLMRVELSAVWNHGIDSGRLLEEVNPWTRIPVASVGRRSRVLSDSELKQWLLWLPTSGLTQGMRDIAKLVLVTGMRAGEVCGMAWSDVDLDAGEYHLPGDKSKNGLGRTVALNALAVELLKRRGQDSKWVFPNRGGDGHVLQPIYSNALWHVRESCPVCLQLTG